MLTHLWVHWWGTPGDLVSIHIARSLSVLFGVATVPAIFGLGWLCFRSVLVGHLAAGLMAVSPFGVYLAQEARHYTLAMFLAIASFACLTVAVERLKAQISLPVWLILATVIVNSLGMAVHFFFIFLLIAQGLIVFAFWIQDIRYDPLRFPKLKLWKGFYAIALGTAIGVLVWLPIFLKISTGDSQLIAWTSPSRNHFIDPIFRLVAWVITMVIMLPVEKQPLPIIIVSSAVALLVLCLLGKVLIDGWHFASHRERKLIKFWLGFTLVIMAIFIAIAWAIGLDLTLAARYQFIYFPVVLLILAAGLAKSWELPGKSQWRRYAIAFIGFMSLLGGLMVVYNLAYQKPDRSELVAEEISAYLRSDIPTLIATVHKSHEQTGEMMSIAGELKNLGVREKSPFFLLAHRHNRDSSTATNTLVTTLNQWPQPMNLWLINFAAEFDHSGSNCERELGIKSRVPGYFLRMYRCGYNESL
ncbi:glycosyltransferase family 39 protein [Limnospira platensis]|nr:putative membrane protein [Arthrospira platensis C1]